MHAYIKERKIVLNLNVLAEVIKIFDFYNETTYTNNQCFVHFIKKETNIYNLLFSKLKSINTFLTNQELIKLIN